jgi:hypothetical protein
MPLHRLVRQRTCRHGISGTGRRCSIASNIKMYAYDDGVLLDGLLISRVDALTTQATAMTVTTWRWAVGDDDHKGSDITGGNDKE